MQEQSSSQPRGTGASGKNQASSTELRRFAAHACTVKAKTALGVGRTGLEQDSVKWTAEQQGDPWG